MQSRAIQIFEDKSVARVPVLTNIPHFNLMMSKTSGFIALLPNPIIEEIRNFIVGPTRQRQSTIPYDPSDYYDEQFERDGDYGYGAPDDDYLSDDEYKFYRSEREEMEEDEYEQQEEYIPYTLEEAEELGYEFDVMEFDTDTIATT